MDDLEVSSPVQTQRLLFLSTENALLAGAVAGGYSIGRSSGLQNGLVSIMGDNAAVVRNKKIKIK